MPAKDPSKVRVPERDYSHRTLIDKVGVKPGQRIAVLGVDCLLYTSLKQIDKVAKLYLVAIKQAAKLDKIPRSKKRPYLRARYTLARTRVEMSNRFRELDFNPVSYTHLDVYKRQRLQSAR